MADVHDKKTRSYNMSQIKGKDTKPEMLVRRFLHANGFRYRLHVKDLPGKPDIVLPKYKTVIFVHGCFWHGHENCKYSILPKTRRQWWEKKIQLNIQNDRKALMLLRKDNWKSIEIWSCNLKSKNMKQELHSILKRLTLNE